MRLLGWLCVTLFASLIVSWYLWSGLVTSLPPAPIPPTAFERHFGFQVSKEVANLLHRPLPSPMFLEGTLGEGVDRLRDAGPALIFVNWRALEASRISKEFRVSVDVSGQPLGDALLTLLSKISTPTAKIECMVDAPVITISTHDDLAKNTQTRVYDVRDFFGSLLAQPPLGTPARSRFPGWLTSRHPQPASPQEENALLQQFTRTIDPPSWRVNGGQVGAIKQLSGQLIVTQTPGNIRDFEGLLYKMRMRRRLYAIALRAAFLTGTALLICLVAYFITRRHFLARARRRAGLCPNCGYDMRASAERCPECGNAVGGPRSPKQPPPALTQV